MASDGWSAYFRTRFNDILRHRRIKGKEVAQALDVHPNTIARWRNATNTCGISAASLVELSQYLNMSPAQWFLKTAGTPGVQKKLRRVLDYMESLDEAQLDRFLTMRTRPVQEKLRRVLDYMESLDETQLDRFLDFIDKMINLVEGRFAGPGGGRE